MRAEDFSGWLSPIAGMWRHRFLRAPADNKPRTERNRRGGRDLHPRILQGPVVRSAATDAPPIPSGENDPNPPKKDWDCPTDRALPKPDISSATNKSGGMFIAENQKLG
jgi:hypothetical protein